MVFVFAAGIWLCVSWFFFYCPQKFQREEIAFDMKVMMICMHNAFYVRYQDQPVHWCAAKVPKSIYIFRYWKWFIAETVWCKYEATVILDLLETAVRFSGILMIGQNTKTESLSLQGLCKNGDQRQFVEFQFAAEEKNQQSADACLRCRCAVANSKVAH